MTELTDIDNIQRAAKITREQLRAYVDGLERTRDEQPARLAELRAQAEQARTDTMAVEPWLDCLKVLPATDADTGELTGMMSFPSIDAKEAWGARLAFDLADAGGDDAAIDTVLDRYFSALHGSTEHLFIVFSAALVTLAKHVMPVMVDKLEREAADYASRVTLADAARNAWATRITDDAGGA